jgi:hypothetical protein
METYRHSFGTQFDVIFNIKGSCPRLPLVLITPLTRVTICYYVLNLSRHTGLVYFLNICIYELVLLVNYPIKLKPEVQNIAIQEASRSRNCFGIIH